MQHVLVVDDQPEIRAVVQLGLEELGHYRVSAVATGERALRLLDVDRPDLVVLDAVLPGMTGIELAAHAVLRDIPVVVITGEPATEERLERAGWPHLRKPFHVRELVSEVRTTIAQAYDNNRAIRASLDRLFETSGDLWRAIDRLAELRREVKRTMARSRRLIN